MSFTSVFEGCYGKSCVGNNLTSFQDGVPGRGFRHNNSILDYNERMHSIMRDGDITGGLLPHPQFQNQRIGFMQTNNRQCNNVNQNFIGRGLVQNTQIENGHCFSDIQQQNSWHGNNHCMRQINDHVNNFDARNFQNCRQDNQVFVNDFIGEVNSGSGSHFDDGRNSIRNKHRINTFKNGQKNKLHLDRNGDFHHGRVRRKINTKRPFSTGRLGHNRFKGRLTELKCEKSDCVDKNLIKNTNSKSKCEHSGENHYSEGDIGSPTKVHKYPRGKFTDRLSDKKVLEIVDDCQRERSNSHRPRDQSSVRNRGDAKETSDKWHTDRSYEKQDNRKSVVEQFSDRSSEEKYCSRSSNSERYPIESKTGLKSDRSSEERYLDRSRTEHCTTESKTEQYLRRSSAQHCDNRYSSEHYTGRSSSSERYSSRSSAERYTDRFSTQNSFDKSSAERYIDRLDKEECSKRSFEKLYDKGLREEHFDDVSNISERSYAEPFLNKSGIEDYQEKPSSVQHSERRGQFEVSFDDGQQRTKSEDRFHRSRQDRFQKHFRGRGRGFRLSRPYSSRSFYHRHKFSSDIGRMSHKRSYSFPSPESIPRKKGKFLGNIENEERRKSMDIKTDNNDNSKKVQDTNKLKRTSDDDSNSRNKHRKVENGKKNHHGEKSNSNKDKLLKKHKDKHLKERNYSSESKTQAKCEDKPKRKLIRLSDSKTSIVETSKKDENLSKKCFAKECEGREKVLSTNKTPDTGDKSPSKSSEMEKMEKHKDRISDCTSSSLSKSGSSEMDKNVTKPSSTSTSECTSSKTEADLFPANTNHIDMPPISSSTVDLKTITNDAVVSKKGETSSALGIVDVDFCSSNTSAPSDIMDTAKQAQTTQENFTTKFSDGQKVLTERNATPSYTSKQCEKTLTDSNAKAKSIANNQFKTVEKILCREKELPTLPKIQKKTKSSDSSTKTASQAVGSSSKSSTAEKSLKISNTSSQSDKPKKSSKHSSSKSEHKKDTSNPSKQACDKSIKSSSLGKETSSKSSSLKLVKSLSEDQETVSKSFSDTVKPVKLSSVDKQTNKSTNEAPKPAKSSSVDKDCGSGEMPKLVKSTSVEKEMSNKASVSKSKTSKHLDKSKSSLDKNKMVKKHMKSTEKNVKSSKVMEKDLSSSKSECVPAKQVDRTTKSSVEKDAKSSTPTKAADRTKSASVERESQKSDSKSSLKHGDKTHKSTLSGKAHTGVEKCKSVNETLHTNQQVPSEFDDMLPQLVHKSKRRDRISPKSCSVKGSPQKNTSEMIDKENMIGNDKDVLESSGSDSDHVSKQSNSSNVVSESASKQAQVVKALKTDLRRTSADDLLRHGSKTKSKTLLRKCNSYDGKEGNLADISFDQSKHDSKQEKSGEQTYSLSKKSDDVSQHSFSDKSLEASGVLTENKRHLEDHGIGDDQVNDNCSAAVPGEDSMDHRGTELASVKGISSSAHGHKRNTGCEGKSSRERNFFDDFQLHDDVNPFSKRQRHDRLKQNEAKHNVEKHKNNHFDRTETVSSQSIFATPSVFHKSVSDKNTNHNGEKISKKSVKGSGKENRKRKHSGKENFDQEKNNKKDKLESKGQELSEFAENCDKHHAVDNLEVNKKEQPCIMLNTNTSEGSVSALSDITELSDTSLVPLVMSTPITKSAAVQSAVDKTSTNDLSCCSQASRVDLFADTSERVIQTNKEDTDSNCDVDGTEKNLLGVNGDGSSDSELVVALGQVDSESKPESSGDQVKGDNSSAFSYLSSFENISDTDENDNCDDNEDADTNIDSSSSSDNEDDNRLFIDYDSPTKLCEKQNRESDGYEKCHSSTPLTADDVTSLSDEERTENKGHTRSAESKEMDSTFLYGQTSSHSSSDLPGSVSEIGEEINSKEFEDIPDNTNSRASQNSSENSNGVSGQSTEGIQTSMLGCLLSEDEQNETSLDSMEGRQDSERCSEMQSNKDKDVLDSNNFKTDVEGVQQENQKASEQVTSSAINCQQSMQAIVSKLKTDRDNVHLSCKDYTVEEKADNVIKPKEINASSFMLTPKQEPMDFEDIPKSRHSDVVKMSLGRQLSVDQSNSSVLESSDAVLSSKVTELTDTTTMILPFQIKREKNDTVEEAVCDKLSACSENLDDAGARSAPESILNNNMDNLEETTDEPCPGVTSDQLIPEEIENNQDLNVDTDFDEDEIDDGDIRLMIYDKGVPQSPWTPMPPTPYNHSPSDEEFEPVSVLADLEPYTAASLSNREAETKSDSEDSWVPSSQPNSPDCEKLSLISATEDLDSTQIYTTEDKLPMNGQHKELMASVQQNPLENVMNDNNVEESSLAADHTLHQNSEDLQQLQSQDSAMQPRNEQSSIKIVSVDSLNYSMLERLTTSDESAPSDKTINTSLQNPDNACERLTKGAAHGSTDHVELSDLSHRSTEHTGSLDLTNRSTGHVESSELTHGSTSHVGSSDLTNRSTDHTGSSDLTNRLTAHARSSELTHGSTGHVGSSNLTNGSMEYSGSSDLTNRLAGHVGSSELTHRSTGNVGSSDLTCRSTEHLGSSDLTGRSADHVGSSELTQGSAGHVGSSDLKNRSTEHTGPSDLTCGTTDFVGSSDLTQRSTGHVRSSDLTHRSTGHVGSSALTRGSTEHVDLSLTPEEAAALKEKRDKSNQLMELIRKLFRGFDKSFFIELEHCKIYEGGMAINTRASYYPQYLLRKDWRCIICQSCQECFSPLGFTCHICQRTPGYSSALKLNEYETLKRAFVQKSNNGRPGDENTKVEEAWRILKNTRMLECLYCASVDKTCKINKKSIARIILQSNGNNHNRPSSSSSNLQGPTPSISFPKSSILQGAANLGRDDQVRQLTGPHRSLQQGAVKQGPVISTPYQQGPGSLPQASVAQRSFQQESISQLASNRVPVTKPSGCVSQRPYSQAQLQQESVQSTVGRCSSVSYKAPLQVTSHPDHSNQVNKSLPNSDGSNTYTALPINSKSSDRNALQLHNPAAAAGVRDSGMLQPSYNKASHNRILKELLQINASYPSQQWPHVEKGPFTHSTVTQVSSVPSVEGLPSSTNANVQFVSSHVTSTVTQNSQTVTNSTSTISAWNPFDTLPEFAASNLSNLSSLPSKGVQGHNNFIPQNLPYSQPQQFKISESRPVNVQTTLYASGSSNHLGYNEYAVNRQSLPKSQPNHLLRLLNQNLQKEQNVMCHENINFRKPNKPPEHYISQTSNDTTQNRNNAQSQISTSQTGSQHLPGQATQSLSTVTPSISQTKQKRIIPGQQVTAEELIMMTQNLCQRPTAMNQNLNQEPSGMNKNPSQGPSGLNQNLSQGPLGMNQNLSQRPLMNQNLSQGQTTVFQNEGLELMTKNKNEQHRAMTQSSSQCLEPSTGTQNSSQGSTVIHNSIQKPITSQRSRQDLLTGSQILSHGPSEVNQNFIDRPTAVSQNVSQEIMSITQISRQDHLTGSQISGPGPSAGVTQNRSDELPAVTQHVSQEIMSMTQKSSQEATSVCQTTAESPNLNRRPSTENHKSNEESADVMKNSYSANGLASDVISEMDDIMRDFQEGVSKQVRAMTRMQKLVRVTNDMMDRNQKRHEEEIQKYKEKQEKMDATIKIALETIKFYMNEEES